MSVDSDPAHLHPLLAYRVGLVVAGMGAAGHPVEIFEGLRLNARQDELYAKGRTEPGEKVTNAKAGESRHNPKDDDDNPLSEAADLVFVGIAPWGPEHPWQLLGELAESVGLTWGGRWTIRDLGHVELPKGDV
jgi:peptidoglycan L-alanyl-D-glutamate endopeptidase CwlK